MNKNEIVIFETEDQQVKLPVNIENETVWLNRNQMAEPTLACLFEWGQEYIKERGKAYGN